jgi:hypothetical protein
MVSFDDIARAHERIKEQAKRMPVLTSATVNALTDAQVFFKCENSQPMGAFKFRGAYNALSQLKPEQRERGTALIAMLFRYLQLCSRFGWSLANLIALLRMKLFTHRDLMAWLEASLGFS